MKDKFSTASFCSPLVLSLSLFSIKTSMSKSLVSIYRSNMGGSYCKCIPRGAQTHIITHTKAEPRGRQQNPFLCRKTILGTIKYSQCPGGFP